VKGFCTATVIPGRTTLTLGGTQTDPKRTIPAGCESATIKHPTACKCICNAIANGKKTIELYRRQTWEGQDVDAGPWGGGLVRDKDTKVIISGNGNSNVTGLAGEAVPDPDYIIFAHELCGHAVPELGHQMGRNAYTTLDRVIQIENEIRQEQGLPLRGP
jgi:hypothetical protein